MTQQHISFSKAELENFISNCSSINKKGEIHPRAMLDNKGNPLPLEVYMKAIGARTLVQPCDFSKSPGERKKLAIAKAEYKADMRSVFGKQWKKTSKYLGYRNPPVKMEDRKVAREAAKSLVETIQ